MNNNPAVRSDSILAKLIGGNSVSARVKDADIGMNLSPANEKKVNQIVERILNDADDIVAGHDSVGEVVRSEDAFTRQIEDESARQPLPDRNGASKDSPATSGSFRLPPLEECGLWNPNIELDQSQIEAVDALATQQYGCLIGAAGTGKTTVQKYLLRELIYGKNSNLDVRRLEGKQGLNIAMVAFTGMAVQVMKTNLPTWMHEACKTIHALLEFEPEDTISEKTGRETRLFMPQRNSVRKLDIDVLVIDEASMLGLELWMQLLAALKPGCRIYMTGDLNQLPPIIGQPIFAYALARWHVSELTKVHRQKEPGANRIVEVAHQILNGETNLTFDVLKGNPDWRVIYQELDSNPSKAADQIINILNQLRQRRINPADPESPFLYNPHTDRVMTPGNGYTLDTTKDYVQQAPLNERLSLLIEPPSEEHPRFIIDAGRVQRKFSVHNRVMATKNEQMNKVDRVTNGQAGTITEITRNAQYRGNPLMFGPEEDVQAYIRAQIVASISGSSDEESAGQIPGSLNDLAGLDFNEAEFELTEEEQANAEDEPEDDSGLASHSVTVLFDNGAIRTYSTKAAVESIQLAYCSTVAKCQGSQFDTAILICHHANKMQLSREWLYTAVTRGVKRVIILGTDFAVRYAISRQKIKGATLAEKIQRYQELLEGTAKTSYGTRLKINVPLTIEDFTSHKITFDKIGRSEIEDANQ